MCNNLGTLAITIKVKIIAQFKKKYVIQCDIIRLHFFFILEQYTFSNHLNLIVQFFNLQYTALGGRRAHFSPTIIRFI